MLIIAIDPGLTTGLVVADEKGPRLILDIDHTDIPRVLDHVFEEYGRGAVVYVEEPPAITSNASSIVKAVEREIARAFNYCRRETVAPATWKPHPRARDLSAAMAHSPHTKDAMGIASYALWKEGQA